MDLRYALALMGSPINVFGRSDATLAAEAQQRLKSSIAFGLPYLDGGITVRPVQILHELAVATRFAYAPDVFEVYRYWALMRYVGGFDRTKAMPPALTLSAAARKVRGHQRAIMSEEFGVGMSVVLARRWFEHTFPGLVMDTVDVDVAIASGMVDKPKGRRADFVLSATAPGARRMSAHGVLESKGATRSDKHARDIPAGAGQVEATTIQGKAVPGIVGGVLAGAELRYAAVGVQPLHSGGPVDLGEVGRLDGGTRVAKQVDASRAATDVFGTVLARYAEIADVPELFLRLAPARLRAQRRPTGRRGQAAQEVVNQVVYTGTRSRVPLPGGEMEAFLGVDRELIGALWEGDFATINRVRARPSRRGDVTAPAPDAQAARDEIVSTSTPATALVLRALRD
ncbi:hypothetical protein [Cellulomonas palmilytica]|uniref:hypothetical protein n=1 Tax=Cellulomonas palmilytica TaxID=2608402 RepID=UPI001F2F37D2|nr:hypothetical protein [Cellulomonas palmilytica]UJP41058.1 hypothetical protein F1D97_06275 [Cellulomonas palmilytica]